MKKFILFYGLIALIITTQAQSLQLINVPTTTISGDGSRLLVAAILVKNISTDTVVVKVRRVIHQVSPDHDLQLCFGPTCYPEETEITPNPAIIAPGDTNKTFKAQLESYGLPGSASATYYFIKTNGTPDSVTATVNFNVVTSLEDLIAQNKLAVQISPNPAVNLASINYTLPNPNSTAQINIYDILGGLQKQQLIKGQQGSISLDLSNLKSGVYFYSLVIDGRPYITKRLIVTD
ncbi:MAG: T9SS type A sorting domain-containing protein [Bacteroidia bacterium]|nr:T9SS type A sorting domain-containing protein [Bacteroidia bacterium]